MFLFCALAPDTTINYMAHHTEMTHIGENGVHLQQFLPHISAMGKNRAFTYAVGALAVAALLVVFIDPVREKGLAIRNTLLAITSTDLVTMIKSRGTDLIPLLLTDLQQFVTFKTIGAGISALVVLVSTSALAPYVGGLGTFSFLLSVVALGVMVGGYILWQWEK